VRYGELLDALPRDITQGAKLQSSFRPLILVQAFPVDQKYPRCRISRMHKSQRGLKLQDRERMSASIRGGRQPLSPWRAGSVSREQHKRLQRCRVLLYPAAQVRGLVVCLEEG
jgi:hypothetical protein